MVNGKMASILTRAETIQAAGELMSVGALHDALDIFLSCIKADPGDDYSLYQAGVLLMRLHSSHNALPFLLKAIKANPKNGDYWLASIQACSNSGNFKHARVLLDSVSKVSLPNQLLHHIEKTVARPDDFLKEGKLYRANNGHYLDFLRALHLRTFSGYLEIGSRDGSSLQHSRSPSIAVDPFFQITTDPVGDKQFCILVQEKSDDFFKSKLPDKIKFECEVTFIDGMHLFEFALRDFLNSYDVSRAKSLFLFHDVLPWTLKMATRDYTSLGRQEAWTGDIWKLPFIFCEYGMTDCVRLLTSAPSGLLALFNLKGKDVRALRNDYEHIVTKWRDVQFTEEMAKALYSLGIFEKPESYLKFIYDKDFGVAKKDGRQWVSQ